MRKMPVPPYIPKMGVSGEGKAGKLKGQDVSFGFLFKCLVKKKLRFTFFHGERFLFQDHKAQSESWALSGASQSPPGRLSLKGNHVPFSSDITCIPLFSVIIIVSESLTFALSKIQLPNKRRQKDLSFAPPISTGCRISVFQGYHCPADLL